MHAVCVESLAEKQKDVCSEKKMPVCIYTTPLWCFRYGLPVNFQAMLLQPNKKTVKKLREVLHELYKHLDSSAAAIIDVSTRQLSRRKAGTAAQVFAEEGGRCVPDPARFCPRVPPSGRRSRCFLFMH